MRLYSYLAATTVTLLFPFIPAASAGPFFYLSERCNEVVFGEVLTPPPFISFLDEVYWAKFPREKISAGITNALRYPLALPSNPQHLSSYGSIRAVPSDSNRMSEVPWYFSKIPFSPYREFGFTISTSHFFKEDELRNPLGYFPLPDFLVFLEKFFSKIDSNSASSFKPLNPMNPIKLAETLATEFSNKAIENPYFNNSEKNKYWGLCSLLGTPDPQCAYNIEYLKKHMLTGNMLTGIGGIYLIPALTDASYEMGARSAALKILRRIKERNLNGTLFNDVYNSYFENGLSEKDSEEHAWNLIFLSFVHGQNLYHMDESYLQPYNFWAIRSAQLISAGSVLLDSYKMESKLPMYTIPPSVISSCDNGKPYHFWVTAFLARKLKKLNKRAPAKSAYYLDLGYQMLSNTYGRFPEKNLAAGKMGGANLRNRLDLSYAAAGARYGVGKVYSSIDLAFNVSLEESENPEIKTHSVGTFKWVYSWVQMIKPTAIFDYGSTK